jgi:hypothetical protein
MNQPDCRRLWIDKVNCAAIRDVNAKRNLSLIRDQAVRARELFVALDRLIDNGNLVSVNLLRGQERPISDSNIVAIFAMNGIQTPERFRFVRRDVDVWNARDERVANIRNRIKRWELFES